MEIKVFLVLFLQEKNKKLLFLKKKKQKDFYSCAGWGFRFWRRSERLVDAARDMKVFRYMPGAAIEARYGLNW